MIAFKRIISLHELVNLKSNLVRNNLKIGTQCCAPRKKAYLYRLLSNLENYLRVCLFKLLRTIMILIKINS